MYKRVIFPVDINTEDSFSGCLDQVIDIVKAFDSKLYIMSVIPDYGMSLVQQYFPKGWLKETAEKSKQELNKLVAEKIPSEIDVTCLIGKGAVYQCIIDKATELSADLIVVPAHRPELRDYLLGPNAAKVVRHANISVLVMRS